MGEGQHLLVSTTVGASPDVVFHALTDATAMEQWFAEYAEVNLPASRFGFWGRYTPHGEDRRQRLIAVERNRSVTFGWQVSGEESAVDLSLSAAGRDATHLALTQWAPPGWCGEATAMLDFWCLSVGNLANYAEGRTAVVRHDFTRPAGADGRAEIVVRAPVTAVFAALTVPAELERWIAGGARVQARTGGCYDFGWGEGVGPSAILELRPPALLVHTWREPGAPDGVVRWELTERADGTLVAVSHRDAAGGHQGRHRLEWANLLIDLQRMLEVGRGWHRTVWRSSAGGPGVADMVSGYD